MLLVHITSTHRPGSDTTVGECSISKKNPTITQDLSRRCIATSGESVSTYPHRMKAEAFSNAVDVVKRLHDPTDPSTERKSPPRSAHVQLDDVPRSLDPVEDEGEFEEDSIQQQHNGVVTILMFYQPRASPKHRYDIIEVDYGGGGHHTRLRDQ